MSSSSAMYHDARRMGATTRGGGAPADESDRAATSAERGPAAAVAALGAGCGETRLSVLDGGLPGTNA